MNTCDTCKWWLDPYWKGKEPDGYYLYGVCKSKKTDADYEGYPIDGLSGGEPAECTAVSTGPKFGCIHHEPK